MKPQTRRSVLALAATLSVVALIAVFYGRLFTPVHRAAPPPPQSLAKLKWAAAPKVIPTVTFSDGTGRTHQLSEFRGHYVLMNLWATWCAPCVKELPALAGLRRALANGRLVVIAVSVDRDDTAEISKFLITHRAGSLPVYRDVNMAFLHAFGAFGLPLTVLVDPRGREVARATGAVPWDDADTVAYFRGMAGKR